MKILGGIYYVKLIVCPCHMGLFQRSGIHLYLFPPTTLVASRAYPQDLPPPPHMIFRKAKA